MAKKTESKDAGKTPATKEEGIELIRAKMEKDFGKGTLIGAREKPQFHDYIPTGSLGLDKALGIGGLPKGRIIEIYGPESSGKTTMAIHLMAEAHKDPAAWCAFVDAEHAFDAAYAEALGVDLDRLKISQPSYGEQALEVAERLCASGYFEVVVIDSVAALVPKAETEREMGESSMGKQAMLMGQAMRKLTPVVAESGTILLFINQLREKLGVMFGSPETTPGGNALKFYASVRLDIRRSITKDNSIIDKDGETKLGNQTIVRVVKNKTAPPFRKAEFDILYGEGIDKCGELIAMAIDTRVMTKAGTYFGYNGTNIAQGLEATKAALKENDKLFEEIKTKVIQTYTPVEFEPSEEK